MTDRLFAGLPGRFPMQTFLHQCVLRLPPVAGRLAGNQFDRNHAFRLGDSVWGVQFHLEFDVATPGAVSDLALIRSWRRASILNS